MSRTSSTSYSGETPSAILSSAYSSSTERTASAIVPKSPLDTRAR